MFVELVEAGVQSALLFAKSNKGSVVHQKGAYQSHNSVMRLECTDPRLKLRNTRPVVLHINYLLICITLISFDVVSIPVRVCFIWYGKLQRPTNCLFKAPPRNKVPAHFRIQVKAQMLSCLAHPFCLSHAKTPLVNIYGLHP